MTRSCKSLRSLAMSASLGLRRVQVAASFHDSCKLRRKLPRPFPFGAEFDVELAQHTAVDAKGRMVAAPWAVCRRGQVRRCRINEHSHESDHRILPIVKCENRLRNMFQIPSLALKIHQHSRVGETVGQHALPVLPTAPSRHALKRKNAFADTAPAESP